MPTGTVDSSGIISTGLNTVSVNRQNVLSCQPFFRDDQLITIVVKREYGTTLLLHVEFRVNELHKAIEIGQTALDFERAQTAYHLNLIQSSMRSECTK